MLVEQIENEIIEYDPEKQVICFEWDTKGNIFNEHKVVVEVVIILLGNSYSLRCRSEANYTHGLFKSLVCRRSA